jgi:nitrite reductase/ring-hydroxylating ferredoxin subunit/uncharacterized membrane protein
MKSALEIIDEQEWLEKPGDVLQPLVLDGFKAAGKAGSAVKDALHGRWLGHPLHPVITDIPLGAWTTAAVLDCMELCGKEEYKAGADAAIAVGLAGAAGAAITGITDWSGTTGIERKTGLLHGMLNISATALYISAVFLRKGKKTRNAGIALSLLGYGITGVAAYLGGELVFNKQVGVNHTGIPEGYPEKFVAVLPESELHDNEMKCVRAEKVDVLLVKKQNQIFAIANTCSHLGGPLAEGDLVDDNCVRCPWHQSIFSLTDGSVVEGPATHAQPTFEVRVRDGQIEVKLKSNFV